MQCEAGIDDCRHTENQHPGSLDEDALQPLEPCIDLVVPLGTNRLMAAELRFKTHGWLHGSAVLAGLTGGLASESSWPCTQACALVIADSGIQPMTCASVRLA